MAIAKISLHCILEVIKRHGEKQFEGGTELTKLKTMCFVLIKVLNDTFQVKANS